MRLKTYEVREAVPYEETQPVSEEELEERAKQLYDDEVERVKKQAAGYDLSHKKGYLHSCEDVVNSGRPWYPPGDHPVYGAKPRLEWTIQYLKDTIAAEEASLSSLCKDLDRIAAEKGVQIADEDSPQPSSDEEEPIPSPIPSDEEDWDEPMCCRMLGQCNGRQNFDHSSKLTFNGQGSLAFM